MHLYGIKVEQYVEFMLLPQRCQGEPAVYGFHLLFGEKMNVTGKGNKKSIYR